MNPLNIEVESRSIARMIANSFPLPTNAKTSYTFRRILFILKCQYCTDVSFKLNFKKSGALCYTARTVNVDIVLITWLYADSKLEQKIMLLNWIYKNICLVTG